MFDASGTTSASANPCAQCDYGFIVDTNASNDTCATANGVSVKGLYNCGVYDSTNTNTPKDCTSCVKSL